VLRQITVAWMKINFQFPYQIEFGCRQQLFFLLFNVLVFHNIHPLHFPFPGIGNNNIAWDLLLVHLSLIKLVLLIVDSHRVGHEGLQCYTH
jgi:hypothetical protein